MAIEKVLKRGIRTAELPGRGRPVTTSRMGDLIAAETRKQLAAAARNAQKPAKSKRKRR